MMSTFWDKIACIYDLNEYVFNGKVYKAMLHAVKNAVPEGAKVLECAAGTGEISVYISPKCSEIICTDQSAEMLAMAVKKAEKHHAENITFEKRDIFSLEDADCTYDAVIAGNVLHLLDDPQAAFNELYRVTKHGGRIILPTFLTDEKRSQLTLKLYRLIGFRPSAGYTADTYGKMLRSLTKDRLWLKKIDGNIPLGFAMIEKK